MQTTNDSSQQNDYSIDQDLRDTLIAISVVARRLARRLEQEANLRQQEGEKGNEQDQIEYLKGDCVFKLFISPSIRKIPNSKCYKFVIKEGDE